MSVDVGQDRKGQFCEAMRKWWGPDALSVGLSYIQSGLDLFEWRTTLPCGADVQLIFYSSLLLTLFFLLTTLLTTDQFAKAIPRYCFVLHGRLRTSFTLNLQYTQWPRRPLAP